MKLATTLLLTVQASRVVREDSERRYYQLVDMMLHHNSDFDDNKYFAYGCNCLILGDFPMSDPGHGPPVDALDTVCKAYKDCLKCARITHGEDCLAEFVKYDYTIGNDDIVCSDAVNTCGRDLCMCDKMFAENHATKTDVFNSDYHLFASTLPFGWEPKSSCPSGGGGGASDPQCCQVCL